MLASKGDVLQSRNFGAYGLFDCACQRFHIIYIIDYFVQEDKIIPVKMKDIYKTIDFSLKIGRKVENFYILVFEFFKVYGRFVMIKKGVLNVSDRTAQG